MPMKAPGVSMAHKRDPTRIIFEGIYIQKKKRPDESRNHKEPSSDS